MFRRLPSFTAPRAVIGAALSLGIASQLGQVLLLRELLMVFYGSEFSIGIILASWMGWVGLGSWLGGGIARVTRRPLVVLAVSAAGVAVAVPATIFAVRLVRGFFDVLPGEYLSLSATVWSCLLFMAPACLLLGILFVFIARVWREALGERGTVGAAGTYVFEAAGNALGGVLFSLVLVHLLNAFQVAVLMGVLLPAAALWLMRRSALARPGAARALLVSLFIVAAAAFLAMPAVDERAYRLQWDTFAPDQELVETRQSKYGVVSVVHRAGQYSFFQSGHLAFSTGRTDDLDFELEESAGAVFAHFSAVQHPAPRRVLLIGGGLRGVLREMARHPVDHIDYVELDRALVEPALQYVPQATRDVLESDRVRLITMDGRLFLQSAEEGYDLIIVDVPDPATAVLNRYYTLEFFREASRLLGRDGVLVAGVGSTADLRARALANRNAAIYHTLRKVFSDVIAVGDRFCYFFASNGENRISADPGVLRQRYMDRGVQARGFSEGYFFTLLQPAPLERLNWVLRHHGRGEEAHRESPQAAPLVPGSLAEQKAAEDDLPPVVDRYFINSDLRPIGYYYTVVLWHTLTHAGETRLFDWFLSARFSWVLPVVGGLLVLQMMLRYLPVRRGQRGPRRADARFPVMVAIGTTGFSIMALQIALLFSFQSVYGFVYEMVGLIMALFMAGLALGAATVHRLVRRQASRRVFAAVQLLIALYAGLVAVGIPISADAGSSWLTFVLFSVLTFFAGGLNGASFPLAAACLKRLGSPAESATGTTYGMELMGACLGALLAGVVVAPVMGVVACCLLAGVLNANAFVLILISRRSSWTGTLAEGVS